MDIEGIIFIIWSIIVLGVILYAWLFRAKVWAKIKEWKEKRKIKNLKKN